MAAVTKIGTITNNVQLGGPTLATLVPPTNCNRGGLIAGEAIAGFDACYIKASDGKVYRSKVNLNAVPAAPTATNTADGTGLWNGQALLVTSTFVTAQGESAQSIPTLFKITTTGQLHIAAYTGLDASITAVNTYVNGQLFATTATSAGATAAIDISGATPTLAGSPPLVNKAFKDAAWQVDGFAMESASSGEAVTLYHDVLVNYAAGLTPGALLWVDTTTAGKLNDAQTSGSVHAAEVFDATRIWIKRVKF